MIEIKQSQYNRPDQTEGMHTNGPPNTFLREKGGFWYVLNYRMNEQKIRKNIDEIGFDLFVLDFCEQVK